MLVFLAPASNALYRRHFVADEKGRIFLYCTISEQPFPEIKAPDAEARFWRDPAWF